VGRPTERIERNAQLSWREALRVKTFTFPRRKSRIEERIENLIQGFRGYVDYYDAHPKFGVKTRISWNFIERPSIADENSGARNLRRPIPNLAGVFIGHCRVGA